MEDVRLQMEQAKADAKSHQDVITLAKLCRAGLCNHSVTGMTNGWLITFTFHDGAPDQSVVFPFAHRVGTLIHKLFNGNLDSPDVIKTIRRLMGYL